MQCEENGCEIDTRRQVSPSPLMGKNSQTDAEIKQTNHLRKRKSTRRATMASYKKNQSEVLISERVLVLIALNLIHPHAGLSGLHCACQRSRAWRRSRCKRLPRADTRAGLHGDLRQQIFTNAAKQKVRVNSTCDAHPRRPAAPLHYSPWHLRGTSLREDKANYFLLHQNKTRFNTLLHSVRRQSINKLCNYGLIWRQTTAVSAFGLPRAQT